MRPGYYLLNDGRYYRAFVGKALGKRKPAPAPTPIPTDTVIPYITIETPSDGTSTTATNIIVTGSASDDIAVSKVEVNVDGSPYSIASNPVGNWADWSIAVSGLTVGGHYIQARVTDTSGNQNWHKIGVTVTSPPITPQPAPIPTQPTTPTSNVIMADDFNMSTYILGIGQISPNGLWKCLYVGGGVNQVVKNTDGNGVLQMQPKTATGTIDSSGVGYETYAPQILSTKVLTDFKLDIDMRTVRQLRQNLPPNSWEVGWIMWRFTNESPKSNHHYYIILKPNGVEFGKKDNAPGDYTVEQQIYLPRVGNKTLVFGQWNHYTITCVGFHITVYIDGTKIVDYIDTPKNPSLMSQGVIGFYNEDAQVQYDNVVVTTL